jgi:hypothetical protein
LDNLSNSKPAYNNTQQANEVKVSHAYVLSGSGIIRLGQHPGNVKGHAAL